MEAALEAKERAGQKLPVLLSEWGLEHATRQQIEAVCAEDLVEFDDKSPILEMAERLNDGLRMAHVLPADIGLTIGLETGSIYLPDGSVQEADKIRAFLGANGIEYGKAP